MQNKKYIQQLTTAAMLIAVGILIPLFMPFKLILEPASYTLASHVPIFLSMFISPFAAGAVCIGTTLGFYLSGLSIVVVFRAASHIVFAVLGSFLLKKIPRISANLFGQIVFSGGIAVVHAACEVLVSSLFYSGNTFIYAVLILVGAGGVVHSMIDFAIALFILKALSSRNAIGNVFALNPFKKTLPA